MFFLLTKGGESNTQYRHLLLPEGKNLESEIGPRSEKCAHSREHCQHEIDHSSTVLSAPAGARSRTLSERMLLILKHRLIHVYTQVSIADFDGFGQPMIAFTAKIIRIQTKLVYGSRFVFQSLGFVRPTETAQQGCMLPEYMG